MSLRLLRIPVPLWQRALDQREEQQAEEQRQAARTRQVAAIEARVGLPWGRPRRHRKPKVGDVIGAVEVLRNMGAGRLGRMDCSFWVRCTICGAEGAIFEFNLRKEPKSVGHCWRQHPRRPVA